MMIELHVLGSTKLRREDGAFDHSLPKGPKRLAVLIYLLLARPRGFHRRDKLTAVFWPEMGQKSARNALSNMLYHIREALGKEILTNRGTEEISINREKIWCDAVAFEEALEEDELQKALDLYHGDLLPAFHVTDVSNEFMSWIDSERERLLRQAAESAWKLAEQAVEADNPTSARRWAKKAVSYSEFSEEIYQRLIELLYRIGDHSGVLKAYDEFVKLIREEWDMEPPNKLKVIVEKINEQAPEKSDQPTESSTKHSPNIPATAHPETPRKSSQSSPELGVAAKTGGLNQERTPYRRWVTVAGILLIVVVAGWMVWSGVSVPDSAPPAVSERSIAVLPFTYLGAEDSTDYFSLGMTEEILSRLAQVGDLSVISRTSVMQYQNTEKSLREIAEELGVAAIVEGSVQRVGNRVRIHAQLIDASTDHHLWSESYDRELKNIFAVQSDIAKSIAAELEAALAPEVEERINHIPTEDLIAYELFLRGRIFYNRSTKETNNKAIELLRQALRRDPDFALARAALAEAYAKDAWNFGANVQWADSAIGEAVQAVAMAPNMGDAHAALGFARMTAGRFSKAETSLERALELNPSDWGALNDIGIINLQMGHIADAIRNWKQALKGDPGRAYGYRFNLALAYRILGLLDRAEQGNCASLAMEPDFVLPVVNQAHVELFKGDPAGAMNTVESLTSEDESNPYALQSAGWILILAGEHKWAREPLERAYTLSPDAAGEGYVRVRLGYTLWQAGERERALKLFGEFERFAAEQIKKGNEYGMLPYSMAAIYAVRGEKDLALRWLEQAVVEAGWPYELTTIHDPMLASLHDDKRFQSIVDRMRKRNEESRRQLEQSEADSHTNWLLLEKDNQK